MEITITNPEENMSQGTLTKLRRLLEIKSQLEGIKPLYEEIDAINMELSETMAPGTIVVDSNLDTVHKFVDNFATKNTAFKVASVRRFDVTTETVEKYSARLEKLAKRAAKEAAKAEKNN